MNNNQKKNLVLFIASVILFLAVLDGWQYGFFTLLRFVVFFATAYIAWIAYTEGNEIWVWMLGFIAILFNPFIPIYLTREIWVVIDVVTSLFLLMTIFILKLKSSAI